MSGFCGQLILSNGSGDHRDVDAMDAAMAHWGPDRSGRWEEGPVALRSRLRRVTPQDAADAQPLVEADLALVGHVRLDDRLSLAAQLGLVEADAEETADSRLLALAWRRWGEGCADRVLGDWACAVWDRAQRRLWLARDATGNTCLYYWHDASRVVFSTSLKALLAHPLVPRRPNAYRLARQLAVVVDAEDESSTAYEAVCRLPGGHALRCDGTVIESDAWWKPEALAEFDGGSNEDYYRAFVQLYETAVADRLRKARGGVGLMLSGGLDSGSVAALAAPRLAAAGERLLGLTSVPRFAPDGAARGRLGDEGEVALQLADHVGNLDVLTTRSEQSGLVASIESMLDVHDQPGHAAANYYWILDVLGRARDRRVSVLLTGQGGNGSVSWSGTGNLWPAIRRRQWREVHGAFQEREVGARRFFWRQLLVPALAPARQWLRRSARPGSRPWSGYSAIHPNLVAQVDLVARARAVQHDPYFSSVFDGRTPRAARGRLGRLASAHLGATWMEAGAAFGLDVRDPTRDRRVIEYCWRVPDRAFWAGGLRRGLIRKGMAGLLPPAVLSGARRGLQAADLGHRVLAERADMAAALGRIEAHPLARQWLDVPRMRQVVRSLERGVTAANTVEVVAILLRGVGVGLFLTRF